MGDAQVLKRLALGKTDMIDADRQEILAFLSGSQGSEYVPASGEITGILKEMQEKMEKSLADATNRVHFSECCSTPPVAATRRIVELAALPWAALSASYPRCPRNGSSKCEGL